jgi:hypothetical protein
MINGFWLSTFVLMGMSIGMIYFRYSSKSLETNWPIVYYALTVIHLQLYEGGLAPNFVFTGIIAAALLRFEFMAGWFLKAIQFLEYACLGCSSFERYSSSRPDSFSARQPPSKLTGFS